MNWTDATGYRQGERKKVAPSSWSCDVDGIRLWISASHIDYPGEWVMRFNNGIPKRIASGEMSAENAKKKAIEAAWVEARANMQKWQGVCDTLFAQM